MPSPPQADGPATVVRLHPRTVLPTIPVLGEALEPGEAAGLLVFVFRGGQTGQALRLDVVPVPDRATAGTIAGEALACAVPVTVLRRWRPAREGGAVAIPSAPESYFLPARLETLAGAVRRLTGDHLGGSLHRLAKLQELACETVEALIGGELIVARGQSDLPAADRERVARARGLIGDQYPEKLTIDGLARACGLGRAKLIRGFRALYGCSVHEMISDVRLRQAADRLHGTSEPVSRIAFAAGYRSNAAFARAFARRYGTSPTGFRGA